MVQIGKTCGSAAVLSDKVFSLFEGRGYKLEEGTKQDGVYANGSPVLRALLGGLVKRNKFSVKITQDTADTCFIVIDKAMSGALGGAIGVSRLNREFRAIQDLLINM